MEYTTTSPWQINHITHKKRYRHCRVRITMSNNRNRKGITWDQPLTSYYSSPLFAEAARFNKPIPMVEMKDFCTLSRQSENRGKKNVQTKLSSSIMRNKAIPDWVYNKKSRIQYREYQSNYLTDVTSWNSLINTHINKKITTANSRFVCTLFCKHVYTQFLADHDRNFHTSSLIYTHNASEFIFSLPLHCKHFVFYLYHSSGGIQKKTIRTIAFIRNKSSGCFLLESYLTTQRLPIIIRLLQIS